MLEFYIELKIRKISNFRAVDCNEQKLTRYTLTTRESPKRIVQQFSDSDGDDIIMTGKQLDFLESEGISGRGLETNELSY